MPVLWILAGIVAALVAGEAGLRFLGDRVPPRSDWPSVATELKSKQLADLPPNPDLVLFGSSVTEAAVDPEKLAELAGLDLVYNSALPLSSPLAYEVWLTEVMTNVRPRLLVIGVTIWPTNEGNSGNLEEGILRAISDQPVIERLAWSEVVSNRGVLADWDRLQTRQRVKASEPWTELGHQTWYYERRGGTLADFFGPYGEPRMSDSQRDSLERVIKSARNDGVAVVLLLEPGRYPLPVSENDVASYISWLEEATNEWGIDLWDTYSLEWDEAFFADEAHFNRTGTEAYTEYLASLLLGDPGLLD